MWERNKPKHFVGVVKEGEIFLWSTELDAARKELWDYLYDKEIYFHPDMQRIISMVNYATKGNISKENLASNLRWELSNPYFTPRRFDESSSFSPDRETLRELSPIVERIIAEFLKVMN